MAQYPVWRASVSAYSELQRWSAKPEAAVQAHFYDALDGTSSYPRDRPSNRWRTRQMGACGL